MGLASPVLRYRNATKMFGKMAAIAGVSFDLEAGCILALVGSNGAGKTTLLKMAVGLVEPTAGCVEVGGVRQNGAALAARRQLGWVPAEERSFYWRLTGRQNLAFFAALQGLEGQQLKRRVGEALAMVGLSGDADRRFAEYSTGMKQLLGLARGILHDPPVLLLDEPTRSLSPETADRIHDLLRDLAENRGRGILLSSHNLEEVASLAHQIVILHGGKVQGAGAIRDLCRAAGFPPDPPPDLKKIFLSLIGRPEREP